MSVERFYPRKKTVAPRSLRRIHGDVGQSGKRNSNEEIRPILECASENRSARLGLVKIAAHILKGRIRKSPDIHLPLAVHGPRAIPIWRSFAISHNTGNPVISALVAPFALFLFGMNLVQRALARLRKGGNSKVRIAPKTTPANKKVTAVGTS